MKKKFALALLTFGAAASAQAEVMAIDSTTGAVSINKSEMIALSSPLIAGVIGIAFLIALAFFGWRMLSNHGMKGK